MRLFDKITRQKVRFGGAVFLFERGDCRRFDYRGKLAEVADEDNLQPPEQRQIASRLAAQLFYHIQNVGTEHGHLVDNENVGFLRMDFSLRRRVERTSCGMRKSLNGRVNMEWMVAPSILSAAMAVGATRRMRF